MSLFKSYDIDLRESTFDNSDHWKFGREFLIANRNKYPEERLVTLAYIFVYAEFMGCIYPKPTMDLIKHLSKGFVNDLKEKLYGNVQKINVTDSNVADVEDNGNAQATTSNSNFDQLSNKKLIYLTPFESNYIKSGFMLIVSRSQANQGAFGILQRSCSFCKIKLPVIKYECLGVNNIQAKLYIREKLIAIGTGTTEKNARLHASRIGYNILKEICFTIVVKELATQSNISLTDIANDSQYNNGTIIHSRSRIEKCNKISDDNVGNKILKKMGWKEGDGLGKNSQGCTSPLEITKLEKGVGLGVTICETEVITLENLHRDEIKKHIKLFKNSPKKKLSFTNKFLKKDREIIFKICMRYQLRAHNYGRNAMKNVAIYKKLQSNWDIFNELSNCKDFENDSFILEPPNHEKFMHHVES